MIGPKSQLSAFVVGVGLAHGEENALGAGIDMVGVGGISLEFGDDRVSSTDVGRIIHVEEPVRAVVRMERQTQQSLFRVVEVRQALDVEKVPSLQRSVLNDADGAALLHNKEAIVAGWPLEIQRTAEAAHDCRQRETWRWWRRGWRSAVIAAA